MLDIKKEKSNINNKLNYYFTFDFIGVWYNKYINVLLLKGKNRYISTTADKETINSLLGFINSNKIRKLLEKVNKGIIN